MSLSRHRLYFLGGIVAVLLAVLALSVRPASQGQRVVFSDGSYFVVKKVSYGKNNVYWHDPTRRMTAKWIGNRGVMALQWFLHRWSGPAVNSCVQSRQDHLVVFGDFHLVSGTTRSWEFIGIDGDGNEGRPLETPLLQPSLGLSRCGPCVLADGTNVPNRWPIAVRIYERGTNAVRKLLVQVPAKRAPR